MMILKKLSTMLIMTASVFLLSACSNNNQTAVSADTAPDMTLVNAGAEVKAADAAKAAASPSEYTAKDHDYTAKEVSELEIEYFTLPSAAEESSIYVEPVEGIPDDFIRGVDASEVLSIENSGAKYYDSEGNDQDVFKILSQSGVNYIRLRIWNNPYDLDGNGYGGGNCDLQTAVSLGVRATKYGMKVLIDFHYSDFWADPERQLSPVAWQNLSDEDKCLALYDFTYDSLETLICAGVNVSMVQVGNETNNGLSGETDFDTICRLFNSGSQAVRKISEVYDRDIAVALHYTNSTDYEKIDNICAGLLENNVDYDILGLSYYTFWSGSFEQFGNVMSHVKNEYGKDVMLAEFSYPFTDQDGDCYDNSAAGGEMSAGYTSSVQSQSTMIRDMCALTYDNGGIGVFYWGGTWIPVGNDYETNMELWEKYGSGWATSYADSYDHENVGSYYGGSAWDNQALFDFDGKVLPSLDTFKYLATGTICDPAVDYIPDINIDVLVGRELMMPDTVFAIYNDRSLNGEVSVTWDESELESADTSKDGEYTVTGRTDDGHIVTATVNVGYVNIADNPGFEEEDYSMWDVAYEGDSNPTDFQDNGADAKTGDMSFHFWSEDNMSFTISQTKTDLTPGVYMVSVFSQGGDMNDDCSMELYAIADGVEYTVSFMDTSWCNWQNPILCDIPITDGEITFGVRMNLCPKSWGTLDDFSLCLTDTVD
ncbi:MAG: glycosyl hydrolase 53 family protein [Lachnospiraceae bacterium]|nr:glycosyl hydrolase 53 family protein [Lachnospiraceae bacterium]